MKITTLALILLLSIPIYAYDNEISLYGMIYKFRGETIDGKYTNVYVLYYNSNYIQLDYTKDLDVENVYAHVKGKFDENGIFKVSSMTLISAAKVNNIESIVSGEEPWVTILARFSDVYTTPQPVSYFNELLYANQYPSLNNYWQSVSYGMVSITGNTYGWYNLTNPKSYYEGLPDSLCSITPRFDRLLQDITTIADSDVNYNNYKGINLVYNSLIGNCFFGGSASLTLDGSTKIYRVTFLAPPIEQKYIAHEMGHGFGLHHSSGPYNYPYDSQWDVMSAGSSCRIIDPKFSCLAVHTIGYHKALLGWIPESNIYTANNDATVELYPLDTMANGYMLIKVPITNDRFYTIEARRLNNYDNNIPDNAVIIHEVDVNREIPAQVVDIDNNGNPNDEGAIWRKGEIFRDNINNIVITIIDKVGDKYVINISRSQKLSNYTSSFIHNDTLNALFVLGDSNPHGKYNWGSMVNDLIGSISLATKLGQLSNNGYSEQSLDTNIASYSNNQVTIDWNKISKNVIAIGGPGVNLITYYYDNNRALPFYLEWDNIPYIHSSLTNNNYRFTANTDYAIIGLINDNNKDILIAWGLTDKGTVAATQLLARYENYISILNTNAIIIKWIDSNNNGIVDINDSIERVEEW